MATTHDYQTTRTGRPVPRTPATRSARVNVGTAERLLSAAAGALLTYYGFKAKSKPVNYALMTLGGSLVVRGATGYCPINQATGRDSTKHEPGPIEIAQTFTIYRPIAEVYGFWRQLENLPRFMQHLQEVQQLDARRSHWTVQIPGGLGTVEWDAEITTEVSNRRLAWQSLPDSQIDNSGEVHFQEAPGDKGTELHAIIHYRAPAGIVGQGVAKLLNPALAELVRSDVRRFKELMEAGEVSTITGQPSGRGHDKG